MDQTVRQRKLINPIHVNFTNNYINQIIDGTRFDGE